LLATAASKACHIAVAAIAPTATKPIDLKLLFRIIYVPLYGCQPTRPKDRSRCRPS
jgi:hypothetical protein